MARLLTVLSGLLVTSVALADPPFPKNKEELIALREDVWAEAALRRPGGPSYEFFRDLFPPVGYVNAAFRHYPIVLSAPGAAAKARYVSNGSAINPAADNPPMWYDPPFGVAIGVGENAFPYGNDLDYLDGPRYVDGWLPVVVSSYVHRRTRYRQRVFVPASGMFAPYGCAFVRLTTEQGPGVIHVKLDAPGPVTAANGALIDDQKRALVLFRGKWEWSPAAKTLSARTSPGEVLELAVMTSAMPGPTPALGERDFDTIEATTADDWRRLLARGVVLDVPESRVQNAWRAHVVGNLMTAVGNRLHYSAGNAYDHLYESECSDATRSLMLMGQTADARRFVGPLLAFNRKDTRYHVAGHKLQMLAHYYLVTRDAAYLKEKEPAWTQVIDFVVNSRNTNNGLLPKDRYAGDLNMPVYSLSSNAACWRGLRDMAVVLADLGYTDRAARLTDVVKAYKKAILAAVAGSEFKETTPPFIPMPLLSDDEDFGPFDPITSTRFGSYYDLMAPYVLGSDVFAGTERETWMIEYLRRHGGLAMGMIRSHTHQGDMAGEPGNNVLYGLRYMLTILRRDDVGHALAGFYGQLAQAMTRETFIGGEGSKLFLGDSSGRVFYLPPNTAANAMFLETLRYLLAQDWTDDAGKPHELRLLYGVPGRWLEDGKAIKFERAPTMFGPVSVRCESRLSKGEVVVEAEAPPRPPAAWTLRPPLPPFWRFVSATVNGTAVPLGPNGAVDLTGKTGTVRVRYVVERSGS